MRDMILPEMHYEWLFLTKSIYDPEIFWMMVTALATIALVIGTGILATTSYLPLVRARRDEIRARNALLTERFRNELLTPSAQKIFFLASHGFLNFAVDRHNGKEGMAYFSIIKVEPPVFQQRLDEIVGEQRIIMTFELDDQILNPLNEVAHYEKLGEIEFEDVYRIFADYIGVCFQSSAVSAYIEWMRTRVKFEVFSELEQLYTKIEVRKKSDDALLPEEK
jgi:hypothetical protein